MKTQGMWISVEDAAEAAALRTFGCQPLPSQPFSRQRFVDGGERAVFFFDYTPFTAHLRKRWHGKLSANDDDLAIDNIKRAFRFHQELLEMAQGKRLKPPKKCRVAPAIIKVRDIEFGAALLAMDIPLVRCFKLPNRDGVTLELHFERDDRVLFLQAAWMDKHFVAKHPSHPLSFILAAFANHRNLLAAVQNANPLIVLKQGKWFFHVAKDKENNGNEHSKPSSRESAPPNNEADTRLRAFVERKRVVAGHTLRPLTAGPLAYLQLTKNRFLTLQGDADDVLKQVAAWDDLWMQVAGFVFVLAADRDIVSSAVLSSEQDLGKRQWNLFTTFLFPKSRRRRGRFWKCSPRFPRAISAPPQIRKERRAQTD
jgi:hypothetical protein